MTVFAPGVKYNSKTIVSLCFRLTIRYDGSEDDLVLSAAAV